MDISGDIRVRAYDYPPPTDQSHTQCARPPTKAWGDWSPQARNLTCGGLVPPDRHLIACRYRQLVPPPQKKKLLTHTYGSIS